MVGLVIALTLWAYRRGLLRLWRRAGARRGVTVTESLAFLAGMAVLAVALLSPLETLTGTLLTAHMIQHVLLIAVAPALILVGRLDAVFAFALPQPAHALARTRGLAALAAALRRLARPMPAALLHMAAVWAWHAPRPFQAALDNDLLHDFEHASFFLTALLFWQSMIFAFRSPSALIAAILATLVTLIQGGFLGALITLSGRPLYPAYVGAELWGLTPMQDQQLAGLVMWIPTGGIYLLAGLLLAARLIGSEAREPTPAVEPQSPNG
jgi:putative membrane protein